jgi:acetyl-CoA synthetase
MARVDFGSEIVWRPTPAYVEGSRLRRFMERHDIATLDELTRRSTGNLEGVAWFWDAVLDGLEVAFYEPYQRVLDTSASIPWARWCIGDQLNIVHNCLDK